MIGVYTFVVDVVAAFVSSACNFFVLTIKIFFLLISFALSASSLVLAASVFNLSFISCMFAAVNLWIMRIKVCENKCINSLRYKRCRCIGGQMLDRFRYIVGYES